MVTAEAGVNVRTGPGTAYPIIGVAPQGPRARSWARARTAWWVAVAPSAPNEQGWVAAAYVEATNVDECAGDPRAAFAGDACCERMTRALSTATATRCRRACIVYSASRVVQEGNRVYDLEDVYVVPAAAGSATVLVANNAMQPAVSPDRQTLAFKSMQSDKFGLGGYDLDTAERLRFTRFNEDSNPRWSPIRRPHGLRQQQGRRPRLAPLCHRGRGEGEPRRT